MCRQSDQKAALACMASFGTEDFRDDLPNVTVPTLVIHGEEDLLSVDVARANAEILPHARLEVIPGAGHMPFWEAPVRFFSIVDACLQEPIAPRIFDEAT